MVKCNSWKNVVETAWNIKTFSYIMLPRISTISISPFKMLLIKDMILVIYGSSVSPYELFLCNLFVFVQTGVKTSANNFKLTWEKKWGSLWIKIVYFDWCFCEIVLTNYENCLSSYQLIEFIGQETLFLFLNWRKIQIILYKI